MSRAAAQILGQQTLAGDRAKDRGNDRGREWAKQAAIVVAASLFVALCARVSVPLPFTPVPLTLQNFGVLAVGLLLGSRRGFAALALYLIEGACGLPVFSPLWFSASELHGYLAQRADFSWPIRWWHSWRVGSTSRVRKEVRVVLAGLRFPRWLPNWCCSRVDWAGWPCSRTQFRWRSSLACTGLCLRK